MTALLAAPSTADSVWTIGAPRLLAGLESNGVLDAQAHLAAHGALPGTDLAKLLGYLDGVGLTGRGGAGFPLAAKLRALRGKQRRLIVNGSESEPASHKDRTLLRRTPHLVLDGALAVASSVGARHVTVAVHDQRAADAVRTAAGQRADGSRVRVAVTGGSFVGGEARALVRGLDGGPALPPGRPGHLTETGVLVANAETFAQVAVLLRLGPRRFAETGSRDEAGTTLLSIGGAVARPGVVELPLGTPLGIVLAAAQAAPAQAVVTGGYHGSWHAPIAQIALSRAGLASAGGTLGAGVLLILDEQTCALGELARVAGWLAGESAKQCGPCRFGLPALANDVAALAAGHGAALGAAFGHARAVDGRGACHHPDGAVRFITSGLHLLQSEVDLHLHGGGCQRPVLGQLPIGAQA
jgi:NADH:ubiquinone oxidoreductase subunit F (NADH-binding)